jgi:16S rRNA (guanine966-N2)-methyltransferase
MRIVSGTLGGRRIEVPKGRDIRPTSDKVRGAVFNMLSSRSALEGAHVLDLFCGTGALGLEALSRGAEFCTFIDKSRESLDLTRRNVQAFGLEAQTLLCLGNASRAVQRPSKQPKATLAFLDPPYKQNLIPLALEMLHSENWLNPEGALCVIETEKTFQEPLPKPYTAIDERLYGDTKIMILRYVIKPP